MTIRYAFLIAFGAGSIPIILSRWLSAGWPLLAAVAVTLYGIYVLKRHASEKRAADSIYYLGYILTLEALLVSLLPLAFTQEQIAPEGILSAFSVALSTTLVGLIFRTFIVQFIGIEEKTPEEIQEKLIRSTTELVYSLNQINRQITETNKSMSSSFQRLTDDVDGLTSKLTQRLKELSEKSQSDLEKAGLKFLETLDVANASISSSVLAIMNSAKTAELEISQATLLHADAVDQSRSTLNLFIEDSKSGFKTIERELREYAKASVNAIQTTLESGTQEAQKSQGLLVAEIGTKFGELNKQMQTSLGDSMGELISGIDRSLSEMRNRLSAQFDQLGRELPDFQQVSKSLEQSLNHLDALMTSIRSAGMRVDDDLAIVADVAKELANLGGGVEALSRQLQGFQGPADRLAAMVGEMENSLATAQELNQRLTRILIENADKVVRALQQ